MNLLRVLLLTLLSVPVILAIDQYLFCPVYSFEKSRSFSGESIYNPYATVIYRNWKKCNFHTHTHCWNGLTNGKGNASDAFNAYSKRNYYIHAISNYQCIDTTEQHAIDYISSYEHGYNLLKTHQLVLGASVVCWKDYLLPQTVYNKQNIIDQLNKMTPDGLVVLNHPLLRNGYASSDFKYLTHYSCMEVLNPSCNSAALWDTCLSAGKTVFILGNDDCHDVFDSTKVGRICTFINTANPGKDNVIHALKTGASYAVRIGKSLMSDIKNGNNNNMPSLNYFSVNNNTVYAQFNLPAIRIMVTGQNGRTLYRLANTNDIRFKLNANEPYARITATYKDGTEIFLNPVFRYRKMPLGQRAAGIDTIKTFWLRLVGTVLLAGWLAFALIVMQKKSNHDSLQKIHTTKLCFRD